MHLKLGSIRLYHQDDVILTRNKAYKLALELGVSPIRASFMATKVSEQCRLMPNYDIEIEPRDTPTASSFPIFIAALAMMFFTIWAFRLVRSLG
ncbi:MAG: hypothetical protein COB79_06285, partial [Zetaproteobacteria bacterium]